MPLLDDLDRRQIQGQIDDPHAEGGAVTLGEPARDERDEVAVGGHERGDEERPRHRRDGAREAPLGQGVVERAAQPTPPGGGDVGERAQLVERGGRSSGRAHHGDQWLGVEHLGTQVDRLGLHPDVEVDGTVPEGLDVLGALAEQPNGDVGGLAADQRDEARRERGRGSLVDPDGERPVQRGEVEIAFLREHRTGGVEHGPHPRGGPQREGGGNEPASGPDQHRIVERSAQPAQRAARRGHRQVQAVGGARDAALGEQRVEDRQQVEVDVCVKHNSTLSTLQ